MLPKNLLLKYIRSEEDKLIFQTEAGAEVIMASSLLGEKFDQSINYYISLDSSAIKMTAENQKRILNDLIDNDTEG
jgi:hypothetical protein